jgi:hypothetical protein
MTYSVLNNKKYGSVSLLFTANSSVVVAGNSSVSNVAISDEVLSGASITQLWFGSPSGNSAYWTLKRGANTVFVADSTAYIDFRGNGNGLTLDSNGTLVANLVGSTVGVIIVELKKLPSANNGFPGA